MASKTVVVRTPLWVRKCLQTDGSNGPISYFLARKHPLFRQFRLSFRKRNIFRSMKDVNYLGHSFYDDRRAELLISLEEDFRVSPEEDFRVYNNKPMQTIKTSVQQPKSSFYYRWHVSLCFKYSRRQ
jgi:hypothetical protein